MALLAMTAAASGQTGARDGDATILDEIVVTAQRRSEPLQEVPVSISAYAGEFLEHTGTSTLGELARTAPNFTVASGSQQTNNILTIRGIGSIGNSAIEPSVGVFIDGVYYPRTGSLIGRFHDIESIEVLRGPQGTLFGRNTPAGALNITTRRPTHFTERMLLAGLGTRGAIELGGLLNGELTEALAGRLFTQFAQRGGNGFNLQDDRRMGGREDVIARGRLLFEPSARLSMLVTVDHSRLDASGGAVEVLNATSNPAYEARLTSLYGSSATTADPYDGTINQRHEDDLRDTHGGVSFDLRYQPGNGLQLRSISAWRDWRADVLESAIRVPGDILPRFTRFDTRTLSQELHILSPGGQAVEWLTGLFLHSEDYDIHQGFHAGDDFCVPTVELLRGPGDAQACLTFPQQRIVVSDFAQELLSVAAFGQATWHITGRLSVTGGVRGIRDRKRAAFVQTVANPFATLIRAAESTPDLRRTDAHATWLSHLTWKPGPDLMLFATMASGYKSGGFNPEGSSQSLGAQRRTFGPEKSINHELGLKSTLLAGRMTANVTAYRTDLKDFQERAFDGVSFEVLNVGKVRQQGLEAELHWMPLQSVRVLAGTSYLHSRYLAFPAAPPLPGSVAPQDLAGARKTFSPRWELSADADWTLRHARGAAWFIGGSWQHVSAQNVGLIPNNNPQSVQPGYRLLHVRTGLRSHTGRWEATAHGHNLADKGYCLTIGDQPLGGPLGAVDAANQSVVQRCILGDRRSWNLQLRLRL
jgi:iron complex outermembrane receptor protein